jgi:hypothetical protein
MSIRTLFTRRYLLGGFAVLFAAVLTMTIVRCDPPATASTSFSYIPHEPPRVFVSHHPIRALPGQSVTIRLAPSLRPEDGAVTRAVAGLRRGSAAREELTCSAQTDGTFTCAFTLPTGDADFIYDGHLELASGTRVDARAPYLFTATSAFGSDRLIKLREPVVEVRDLQPSYRMDTAWVRDPTRNPITGAAQYSETQFAADIETSVYAGILQDPVYRWRDDQLGFYLYSDPGFTSSYYSGFDTRCGQNPWPSETGFRTALSDMETLGVLHRHSGITGIEGTVAAGPPPTATTFRDCGGDAVKRAGLGTFAVTGGVTQTAGIAKHEFGHAAFGLGDEYQESDATRRVAAAPPLPPASCCCVSESGTGTTPGTTTIPGGTTTGTTSPGETTTGPGTGGPGVPGTGVRYVQCVTAGGGIAPGIGMSTAGLPTCTNPLTFPAQCGATPQAACPRLSGNCVELRMWLGALPPESIVDTARPNVFESQARCEDGRARALIHPGVEDRARGLGECHELCGPTTGPCPCGQTEAWIVDTNPQVAPSPAMTRPDSMASITAERHGSTCAWCVETSLCVRWQRARGDNLEAAWNRCNAPPENAAELERQSVSLARAIYECIRALTKDWRF